MVRASQLAPASRRPTSMAHRVFTADIPTYGAWGTYGAYSTHPSQFNGSDKYQVVRRVTAAQSGVDCPIEEMKNGNSSWIKSMFCFFRRRYSIKEKAMPLSDGSPGPDLASQREPLSLAWPEIVKRLTEIIGRKLTAYIAGIEDTAVLDQWINGTEPYGEVEERLRFTYQVARTLSQRDSPRIGQAWLTGVNPELDDRVPLRVLREEDLSTVAAAILGAARAFIAGD